MAKRKTCFLVAACVWMALLAYGALNCAYADEPSDGANSWRFLNGELVLSDSGASTDNLGTFEEAAADSADSADGVMACSIETNPMAIIRYLIGLTSSAKGIAPASARIKAST